MVEIPVGKDSKTRFAMVDDGDAELVLRYTWHPEFSLSAKKVIVYAVTSNVPANTKSGKTAISMHRLILGAKRGEIVDHRNHNGLDNRRHNLRYCTTQQNQFNRRGVQGYSVERGRFRARAMLNGRLRNLGSFGSPQEARAAYLEFAKLHHGEFFST